MTIRVTDLATAAKNLRAVLTALVNAAPGNTEASADLRRLCGALSATAETAIKSANLGSALLACFDATVDAGVTIIGLTPVRLLIQGQIAPTPVASIVRTACLRMELVAEARCYAEAPLASRADVDGYLATVNLTFGTAEEVAANEGDARVYRALVKLHAAVAQDLQTRGRPLPRMVAYTFAERRPVLWIANRLYGDGERAAELLVENKMVHPLFAPATGRALSA